MSAVAVRSRIGIEVSVFDLCVISETANVIPDDFLLDVFVTFFVAALSVTFSTDTNAVKSRWISVDDRDDEVLVSCSVVTACVLVSIVEVFPAVAF